MIITVFKDGTYACSDYPDDMILANSDDYLVTIDTAELEQATKGENDE